MTRFALGLGLAVALTLVVVYPLPPVLLDTALVAHLSLAMMTMVLALQVRDPVGCASLPRLMLATLWIRLAANLAATRVLLSALPPGSVLGIVGAGIVGDRWGLGLPALAILAAILVLFIPGRLERVAQLAISYELDYAPGLAMEIEAEGYSAKLEPAEMHARRRELERRRSYFALMGSLRGWLAKDSQWTAMLLGATLVSIGLGDEALPAPSVGLGVTASLSTLLPAYAMTLVVTRMAVDARMTRAFYRGGRCLVGVVVILMVVEAVRLWRSSFFLSWPFLILSGALHLVVHSRQSEMTLAQEPALEVAPLALELSFELWRLQAPLHDQVRRLRRQLAEDLGFILPYPAVNLRDQPEAGHYRIKVAGRELARGNGGLPELVQVLDRTARRHAANLLSRQDVERLLYHHPKEVSLDVDEIHGVLQDLLREGLSIRPLGVILDRLEHNRWSSAGGGGERGLVG